MAIDWTSTQNELTRAGFPAGAVDGRPGPATYTALLWCVANRRPDAAMRTVAANMARYLPDYGIDAGRFRLAEFLANTAHETGGYRIFEESLRYSARRLMQVWPTRFPTLASAAPFAWDPTDPDREDVALANNVYGSRMGNGANGTQDNDGWDHRGSGLLQHTGAAEYAVLRDRLGFRPDDVRDPAKAVLAACDYWQRRSLNEIADRGDFARVRRIINGGNIGLADVTDKRLKALGVLR